MISTVLVWDKATRSYKKVLRYTEKFYTRDEDLAEIKIAVDYLILNGFTIKNNKVYDHTGKEVKFKYGDIPAKLLKVNNE